MYRVFKTFTISAHISLLISLLLSSLFITKTFADEIIIRADERSFPATYKKDDKWEGMDVEIINELLSRTNLENNYAQIPFQRSLFQIKSGEIQLIPNLVKNEARSEYMHWLGPTRVTCIGLVVQEKDSQLPIKTTDELISVALQKQNKIGYLTGASYSPYLDNRLEKDDRLKKVLHFLPDNSQHRQMLKLGRLFGYFYDAFEIQRRIADPDFSNEYQGLALHDYRIEDSCTGAYIGISKKLDKNIYQKIVTSYDGMLVDGTFDQIHLKWLGIAPDF